MTTETHPDFADLTNALAQVKGINEYIDTQKEIADNQKKLLRLYNNIVAKDCPIPEVRLASVIEKPFNSISCSPYQLLLTRKETRMYVREGTLYDTSSKKKQAYHYIMIR